MLIYSLSDPSQVAKGVFFFPLGFDSSSYTRLLLQGDLTNAYFISIARTVSGTLICIFSTSLLAYLVTKKQMFLRKFVYRFVIITMYMNAGLIPWYVTLKSYGLRDSFLLYILPGAVNAFYLILVKTYIEQLPASLEESAEIDGAGFFTVYIRIIFPLCKPIIATIAVYAAVGSWNAWMDNYFLVRSAKLQTLQVILYKYLKDAQSLADNMRTGNTLADMPMKATTLTPENIRMTITIMSVVPIMAVYPFLQKYFIKGIMIGAIKG
jgi:putative aldouronate transport system permease protein